MFGNQVQSGQQEFSELNIFLVKLPSWIFLTVQIFYSPQQVNKRFVPLKSLFPRLLHQRNVFSSSLIPKFWRNILDQNDGG